uniref:C2H2-type domain-containing protein n=1 Tax=Panagrolaimus sp. JU765 TaxID=591449 RepID=A0AC34QAG5_9BILA
MSPDEMIKYFAKASTSTPPLIKCPFCPEHFESEIANQLHQLKDHADVKMEDETDEAMQITKAVAYKMAVENELLMLKEETRGFEQKLSKKFACKKCSRIYHSKDKLEEHYATAHQYYLKLSPRKNRIVLSP